MKLAARDHIWLHTKDIPGSHVVIQSTDPDEQTILEAAQIAAYLAKRKTPLRFPSTIQKYATSKNRMAQNRGLSPTTASKPFCNT